MRKNNDFCKIFTIENVNVIYSSVCLGRWSSMDDYLCEEKLQKWWRRIRLRSESRHLFPVSFLVTPTWRVEQWEWGDEKENTAERDRTRPNEVESLPVAHGLRDGVDDDGQVAADVVHQEEEESDASGANLRVAYLRSKRKFCCFKVNNYLIVLTQGNHIINWFGDCLFR